MPHRTDFFGLSQTQWNTLALLAVRESGFVSSSDIVGSHEAAFQCEPMCDETGSHRGAEQNMRPEAVIIISSTSFLNVVGGLYDQTNA